MSKRDYEYECMRAELFGFEKPNEEEFFSKHRSNEIVDQTNEQIGRVSGAYDELDAVLYSTRKRLNRIQSFQKRIGNVFTPKPSDSASTEKPVHTESPSPERGKNSSYCGHISLNGSSRATNHYSQELGKQTDKLDLLLMKADRAELSMRANNKLIRKIAKN